MLMLNSILERRIMKDGFYGIELTLHENEYFMVYDNINQENAREIINNYLVRSQDDGRPEDVQIKHNKNQRLVTIQANLHYTGNDKTDYTPRLHDYIHHE